MGLVETVNVFFVGALVLWAFIPNQTVREYVWPIRGEEWYKFLPMGALMLCILFNYSTFRAVKDALVVNGIDARAIPFVKLGFVLPASVLIVMLYIFLLNLFGNLMAFYIISAGFILYFLFFVFYVSPAPEVFEISIESIDVFVRVIEYTVYNLMFYVDFSSIGFVNIILNIILNLAILMVIRTIVVNFVLGAECASWFFNFIYIFIFVFGLYGYLYSEYVDNTTGIVQLSEHVPVLGLIQKIISKWTYVVFYILSELFGVLYIGFFFWAKANQDTLKTETKRFYPAFGIIGNVGPILTGQISSFTLYNKIMLTILSFIVLIILYTYISSRSYLYEEEVAKETGGSTASVKKKPKLSVGESISMVFNSRQLLLIASLVIAYGTTMILLEGVWKYNIKLYTQGNIDAYSGFMGYVLGLQGVAAAILLIIGANILKYVSWTVAALITPVIMIGTGFILLLLAYLCDMPDVIAVIMDFL
ncbi:MAG: Npt1/Npt2 family nucleotide transporter, partial [Pseudomonadota bacterium]